MSTAYAHLTIAQLWERIEALQNIQKANPSRSVAWQNASNVLALYFAEMDRRHPAPAGQHKGHA